MKKPILLFLAILILNSCGIYKPSDARKVSPNASERVKKNMEEGRGFRISSLGKKGGDFLFSSSNPMWRASMEKLSFAPLSVVDYGGGIIVTDWFSDETSEEEIKIAVRFLSNEIRSDALKVIVHERICTNNNCTTNLIDSKISGEIQLAILKRATLMEKDKVKKLVKERRKKDHRSGDNAIPQDQR